MLPSVSFTGARRKHSYLSEPKRGRLAAQFRTIHTVYQEGRPQGRQATGRSGGAGPCIAKGTLADALAFGRVSTILATAFGFGRRHGINCFLNRVLILRAAS